MQTDAWLPLTEYALRSGISISTLRRKIKTNAIAYKMEEGRYLIRCDAMDAELPVTAFASTDAPDLVSLKAENSASHEFAARETELREEMRRIADESALRWRALEARIAGLAKKIEMFHEQLAEVKMLVKLFEEKLDQRG